MIGDNEVRWRSRTLIHFSGCDYFRLSRHPAVASMVGITLKKSGLNVAASRLTTGNRKLYGDLEKELAEFFGAETAVILPNGYLAPMAAAQALAGEFTHALVDELSHSALVDAVCLTNCRQLKSFPHRDVAALARLVAKLCRAPRARFYLPTACFPTTAPSLRFLNTSKSCRPRESFWSTTLTALGCWVRRAGERSSTPE